MTGSTAREELERKNKQFRAEWLHSDDNYYIEWLIKRIAALELKVRCLLRDERLTSRLMGISEGFEAGASVYVKEQEDEISKLERANAELQAKPSAVEADTKRLWWCFGSPDSGATRQQIEEILTHTMNLDEARAMIDEQCDAAMAAQKGGAK